MMSLLDHFESIASHIPSEKIQQLQELVRRFRADKIEFFKNLIRSYPEYMVDDDKTVKFTQLNKKYISELTTNEHSDTSIISV